MTASVLANLARPRWASWLVIRGALVGAVLLFLMGSPRAGERAGRLAERREGREKANRTIMRPRLLYQSCDASQSRFKRLMHSGKAAGGAPHRLI